MSVRKSRFIGKILTGVVTTIVAPVLAGVLSQQMDGWEQTLRVLVANELPAAKADWRQPTAEGGASVYQTKGRLKPTTTPPAPTVPEERAGETHRNPSWSR
jgi:hypothetical protein